MKNRVCAPADTGTVRRGRMKTVKGNDVYGVRPEKVTIFIVKKYGVIYRLQGLS